MSVDYKKRRAKKKIIIESIIVFFIAISPFLFKLYDYLPDDNPETTISFLGITIGSNGFNNVSAYIWFLMGKIIPLYLLLFWFLTSKNWWYHILLIPILMYAFQIFEVLFSEDDVIDSENILWLLPVCMVVIPFVYFIRVKLYDKHVHGIDLEAMDIELNYYKDKERRELERAGIKVELDQSVEDDLSKKTPNRALSELVRQFQHGLRSLFNFL